MRVRRPDPVDFLQLPGTELFTRVETPPSPQQTLPAKHLVYPRDASVEIVGRVEDRRVRIRGLDAELQERSEAPSAYPSIRLLRPDLYPIPQSIRLLTRPQQKT